jgi:hypothetical protein
VFDLFEIGARRSADGLGGAVGNDQVGILFLELEQLVEKLVELRVGNVRTFEHVITETVVLDLASEILYPASGFLNTCGCTRQRKRS